MKGTRNVLTTNADFVKAFRITCDAFTESRAWRESFGYHPERTPRSRPGPMPIVVMVATRYLPAPHGIFH